MPPAPEDNADVLSAVDDIRKYERLAGEEAGKASRQQEVDAAKAETAAVQKRLDDHMKEYAPAGHATQPDEPPPPPPPQPTTTVFGTSDGVWPIDGVSKVDGIRLYLGAGGLNSGTSWTGTAELKNGAARVSDGGTIWLSIKDARPADLDRVLKSAPAGHPLIVTYRHEPENDVDDKAMTTDAKKADITKYQQGWASLLPVIKDNGAKSATCLLGDRVSPMKPDNPESVAYHVEGVDCVGFDRYNPGLGNAKSYVDAKTVLAGCVRYAQNRGDYPLVIGEWGTIAVGSDGSGAGGDQAGRRTWAAGYVAEIKAIHADPARPDVPVCLYWNQSRMAFNTDPNHELAQRALDL